MEGDDVIAIWDGIINRLQDLGLTAKEIVVQALSLSVTLAASNGITRKEFDEFTNKLWRKVCEENKKIADAKKSKARAFIGRA